MENSKKQCLSLGLEQFGVHICVLGTIGAGKTTLTEALNKVINESGDKCEGFFEPVSGNKLLPLFYKDKARYALAMQIYMLNKRYEQQKLIQELAKTGVNCVQDSSIFGDTCFVDMLHRDGDLLDEEVAVYSELFMNMAANIMYPTLIVYLNCPAEVSLKRIAKRGRGFESEIPASYVRNLNKEISSLCNEFKRYTFVNEIDASVDRTDEEIEELAKKIYTEAKGLRDNPIISRIGL